MPAEVLLSDDVRDDLRPAERELHPALLEGDPVCMTDPSIPQLPLHRVERMLSRRGEVAADREALTGPRLKAEGCLRIVLHNRPCSFFSARLTSRPGCGSAAAQRLTLADGSDGIVNRELPLRRFLEARN